MGLSVALYFLLRVLQDFSIYRFIVFITFGKISAIVSLNLFPYCPLSPLPVTPCMHRYCSIL